MASDPNTVGAAPWYQSPVQITQITTFISAVIAMFPKWGVAMGLETPEKINTAVTATFGFIAVIAPFVGMVLRAKSTIQPLTLTQGKADIHPATLMANANTTAGTATTSTTTQDKP